MRKVRKIKTNIASKLDDKSRRALVELKKSLQLEEVIKPYASLNDAATAQNIPGLAKGNVEIWYAVKEFVRDAHMGFKFLKDEGKLPSSATLSNTHVLLGKIKETNLNEIYTLMQGEFWSPNGEARQLIQRLKLTHTSMSIGDIIKVGNNLIMVDERGFATIKNA